MKTTIAVLFIENGMQQYELIQVDQERIGEAMVMYQANNPNRQVQYMLNTNHDVISEQQEAFAEFTRLCHKYGFEPQDYKAVWSDSHAGRRTQLIGFITKNKKYTCQLLELETGRRLKASPAYVHSMLKSYRE